MLMHALAVAEGVIHSSIHPTIKLLCAIARLVAGC